MKKRNICIAFLLSGTAISLHSSAQFGYNLKRTADIYFKKGDYYSAANYYQKYLGEKKVDAPKTNFPPYLLASVREKAPKSQSKEYERVVYNLAESFRQYFDYGNAERWYGEAAGFNNPDYPLARYWYGVSLRANGKYAEAVPELEKFLAGYTTKDEFHASATKELANCLFIQREFADSSRNRIWVNKMEGTVNQGGANYAPVWSDANTFFFTSSRGDSNDSRKGKNPYVNQIYQGSLSENGVVSIKKTEISYPAKSEQGVVAFSPDGKRMYITRWENIQGKNRGALYMSEKKDEASWSEPVKLGSTVNAEGFGSEQPFVTKDNKFLLFSSNMPGGAGKYDLWYAPLDASGTPGIAVNMGLSINTPEEDKAPFLHAESQTLVFSSNGRTGMGGFDLYHSQGDFNSWSEPANMGYPINSTKDDMYFYSKGNRFALSDAYISSDRNSTCCLELYSVKKANLFITGKLFDCGNKEILVGGKISVVDVQSDKIIHQQQINATGAYGFEMETFFPVRVVAEKEEYVTKSLMVESPNAANHDTLFNPTLCLTAIPPKPFVVGKPVVMKDIYYDFNKATLRPESYPVLDTLAKIIRMYPDILVQMSAHTDSKGSDDYNLKLSEARAKSCMDYLISKGIQPRNLVSKGYGESTPIAPNTINGKDNPDGRQLNRRTECMVIHY